MYILNDGTEVTEAKIHAEFAAGNAIIVCSHGDWCNKKSLMLDGIERDTIGECYSVWDEVWTIRPKHVHEALMAAFC